MRFSLLLHIYFHIVPLFLNVLQCLITFVNLLEVLLEPIITDTLFLNFMKDESPKVSES